ncbi:hypothetical protein RM543_03535 [Roseicyclus sp. F158]|uniref:Uncharacterized protein n=1 Tax=Tropicimonas omnivorans TaxID=3075590 RepID=A0ABU3DDF0_9RHOB|nr:hypothetical protein [Roseicyclus sp. F158]MDT0681746.1 hypothetical protein [Roseicyclus sp. F158]
MAADHPTRDAAGRAGVRSGAKRVVIHAGLPKTGSTAIQNMLRANENALEQDMALAVREDRTRELRLAAYRILSRGGFRARHRLRRAARDLAQWAASAPQDTVLISDENLLGVTSGTLFGATYGDGPRAVVDALLTAFAGQDVIVVLYTREGEALRRSCHNQKVRNGGGTMDYAGFCRAFPDPTMPARLAADLKADLGARARIVTLEDEADGRVGRTVLREAGMGEAAIDALIEPPRINVSIPAAVLELIREINGLGLPDEKRREVVALVRKHAGAVGGPRT